MEQLSIDFNNKLNALFQCNPAQCQYSACPLYYAEKKCCDAARFISLLSSVLKTKFENVKTYDSFLQETGV